DDGTDYVSSCSHHLASHLEARNIGHARRRRVRTLPLQQVRTVDAGRRYSNQHLLRARLRHRSRHRPQAVRRPRSLDLDGGHGEGVAHRALEVLILLLILSRIPRSVPVAMASVLLAQTLTLLWRQALPPLAPATMPPASMMRTQSAEKDAA